MAVNKPQALFKCSVCGYKKEFGQSCPNCASLKREEDKKDQLEFYNALVGLSDTEITEWMLEWIRKHRKRFHGSPRPYLGPFDL